MEKNIAIIGTLFYLGHFKGEIIRQITKDNKITMYDAPRGNQLIAVGDSVIKKSFTIPYHTI